MPSLIGLKLGNLSARLSRWAGAAAVALGLAFGATAALAQSSTTSVDADFAARCAAPGVTLCNGLDNQTDLQKGQLGAASDGTVQGTIDTTQTASGTGSLMFTLRAGVSAKNIGGFWETDMGHQFAAGDTIYVQYRWRATPAYFSDNNSYWRSSVKQLNIHGPSSTCQPAEFTTIMQSGYPSMYTDCGIGWFTDVNTNAFLSKCTADCLLEQGSSTVPSPNGSGYNCHYQDQVVGNGTGSGCFFPPSDTWITTYEIIKLGAKGTNTTSVYAYESQNGGPYVQWQRVDGATFFSGGDSYFSKIRFETYMTEIASAAPTTAYIWYDELIVSTQPIAAPGSPVLPKPPSDLTVN
jgi:hypothetical protein